MCVQFAIAVAFAMTIAGAADGVAPLGKYTARERRHWAFVPRARPPVPVFVTAAEKAWTTNPVDAFILQRLKQEGLTHSSAADRTTLIRRLYFDLTGLPPSPAQVSEFVADRSPGAYSKLVERLLASPHYGERWGQHWLDVVRFAETDGFEYDTHRNDAWRYRDYVIRAFNNDKPYDRFLTEQLAGDEIGPKEEETLIASGFNRLGPLRKNAGNQEVASSRNEVLTEMTNAVGSAMLGVTLGCARCHDHKFDPLRQSDYYRIQAYFAAVHERDVPRATPEEQAAYQAKAKPVQEEIARLNGEMKELKDRLEPEAVTRRAELTRQLELAQERMPAPLASIHAVSDDPARRSPMHLLARGEYTAKGDSVGMRPLGVLLPEDAPEIPPETALPRAELAKWIVDPDNPLTARVMVNRIWGYHFGNAIVATPNDFGRMGARPTHPELLDYLANEFVAGGFSVKQMHRLILNSNTYRQSSAAGPSRALAAGKDPDNRLLWRFNRRRLEAEEIRDAMLSVSGQLNAKAGGPSVMIPIDPALVSAMYKPSQWAPAKDPAEYARRGVYLIAKRNLRLPFMEVFDAPDTQASCPRRESSTHAPQALELMNGSFANEQADALAQRLETGAGPDARKQVELGYRLVTGRAAKPGEVEAALEFLRTEPRRNFALALLNLNAFLYVN